MKLVFFSSMLWRQLNELKLPVPSRHFQSRRNKRLETKCIPKQEEFSAKEVQKSMQLDYQKEINNPTR